MSITSVQKVDPLVAELMQLHPVEGETVLFCAEAKFSCESFWGDKELTGLCFATNYRFSLVAKEQELLYTTNPYRNIRSVFPEDEFTFQYRLCDDENWFDLSKDSICIVTFADDNLLDSAFEHVAQPRYELHSEQVEGKFPGIFEQMYRGDYTGALEQLQRLKRADPLSGMVDLWIAKALEVSGRSAEAVSHVAKGAWKAIFFHPQTFFAEYLWYPWHSGTLRLLPALADVDEDRWEVQRYLLHAIHAKTQDQLERFVKNSCLAFKSYIQQKEAFEPCWFHFASHCLEYVYPSTKSYIQEVLLLIVERYENLFEEGDAARHLMRGFFLDIFKESYDYISWLQTLQTMDEEAQLKYKISLAQENFAELLSCQSVKPELQYPESYELDEFLGYSKFKNEYDSQLLSIRDTAFKTIGAARTSGITSPAVKQGLYQLTRSEFAKKLEILSEETLGFIVTLLIVEEHMAYGRKEQAMMVIQRWKRKNVHFFGLMTEPYYQHAVVIVQAYEAWTLGDLLQLSDALDKLPNRAPFCWMHELLQKQILTLETSRSAYNNEEEVLEGMLQASQLTDVFAQSALLDLSMRNKAKEFHLLLQEQIQEANSLQRERENAGTLADMAGERVKFSDKSWFSKVKAWFTGRKEQEHHHESDVVQPLKKIKIAIAGESSAGKTTLLNAMFRTNLFFVTQEEATGVPTEIRYGKQMRVEVWDKAGHIRNTLDTEPSWFEADGTTLLEQHLNVISTFLMQHTKVGSPALEWVERVVVYAPLEKLPPQVILVDTPGFNSDSRRTVITEAEMKVCHMCMYIMDARNALKGKEIGTLELIREEAGKTFILLNKMDLVIGDDELDCDGGDAADETVARVRRDLAAYFRLPDVVVYPISSMPKQQLSAEAHRYADHLHEVIEAIFKESEHQQLDLAIDASAKIAIEVHQGINQTFIQAAEQHEQEIRRMEKAIPQDFTIYADQVQGLIRQNVAMHRSEFVDTMIKELNDAFQGAADSMMSWLQSVTSAGTLKNEVQGQATQLLQNALTRIDNARQRELERMGKRTSEEAAAFLQEIYSNLPFPTTFDTKAFLRAMSTEQMTSSAGLQTELNNINYGNGLNGGSVAGAIVGTFLLGPIGTIIGGFLGQLLGGKSLGDVKQEVYNTYINTIHQTWDQVADICDQDLSEERTASFMNNLSKAVQQQLEQCKIIVRREIETKENSLDEQVSELIRMQLSGHQLRRVMERLRQWRMVRRARLG
ncbi:dynamin family protein [Paenibacillus thalictri]|uniref:Dynamin N-terminal domain-containing protein n=1 Tax=Paenibacillus thalictri TaxID=2527873 RepID=A0A4Q9E0B0_9BACL|nr:dynamin family protein [Paenibacillus thalictri]TBL81658.1 hypothetical protein EYB31_01265 [Paenibacillus thalictri]